MPQQLEGEICHRLVKHGQTSINSYELVQKISSTAIMFKGLNRDALKLDSLGVSRKGEPLQTLRLRGQSQRGSHNRRFEIHVQRGVTMSNSLVLVGSHQVLLHHWAV